jgi:hypothetical protein
MGADGERLAEMSGTRSERGARLWLLDTSRARCCEGKGRHDRSQSRLYRVTCAEEEAWRRIERRNTDLSGSLFIARNTFEVLRARFEPLSADEACVEIAG